MLYIFSGLPGSGKSTLSKKLAIKLGAIYVRIDKIEQTLKNCGFDDIFDQGYRVGFQIAADNLKLGHSVIADSVNPIEDSRIAWKKVAEDAEVAFRTLKSFALTAMNIANE